MARPVPQDPRDLPENQDHPVWPDLPGHPVMLVKTAPQVRPEHLVHQVHPDLPVCQETRETPENREPLVQLVSLVPPVFQERKVPWVLLVPNRLCR